MHTYNSDLRGDMKRQLRAGVTPALFELDGLRLIEMRQRAELNLRGDMQEKTPELRGAFVGFLRKLHNMRQRIALKYQSATVS